MIECGVVCGEHGCHACNASKRLRCLLHLVACNQHRDWGTQLGCSCDGVERAPCYSGAIAFCDYERASLSVVSELVMVIVTTRYYTKRTHRTAVVHTGRCRCINVASIVTRQFGKTQK